MGYRFADYIAANVHLLSPQLQWYWHKQSDILLRYSISFADFKNSIAINHGLLIQAGWQTIDKLYLYAGYARSGESFDPNNQAGPTGRFFLNDYFIGSRFQVSKKVGVKIRGDYEDRDNGTSVTGATLGATVKF